jgi:tRNA (cmo5U34)-methyltransferase
MKQVKDHFEEEAEIFDELIKTLIPFYDDMVESLILSLPFNREDEIKVLDLVVVLEIYQKGLKNRFPNAQITSVDMAENMIQIAKSKLSPYRDIEFKVADFQT